jgi:hypothetical protein
MFSVESLKVKHIDFPQLVQYWKENNHFKQKKFFYYDVVKKLGPFHSNIRHPIRHNYGLFYEEEMIGGTHLIDWERDTVRFRTINISHRYRGHDLGWYLIEKAWEMDWQARSYLFGWLNTEYEWWAKRHEFDLLESSRTDTHVGIKKEMLL